jgi:hypothetical protein
MSRNKWMLSIFSTKFTKKIIRMHGPRTVAF